MPTASSADGRLLKSFCPPPGEDDEAGADESGEGLAKDLIYAWKGRKGPLGRPAASDGEVAASRLPPAPARRGLPGPDCQLTARRRRLPARMPLSQLVVRGPEIWMERLGWAGPAWACLGGLAWACLAVACQQTAESGNSLAGTVVGRVAARLQRLPGRPAGAGQPSRLCLGACLAPLGTDCQPGCRH